MSVIPVKTPEGQAEMASRSRQLSQRHRTVLLLVDGKRDADQVRGMAAQAGAPAQCFDDLLAMGLIALPEAAVLAPPSASAATPPQAELMEVTQPLALDAARTALSSPTTAGAAAAPAGPTRPETAAAPQAKAVEPEAPTPAEAFFERTAALYGPVNRPELLPSAPVASKVPAPSSRSSVEPPDDSVFSARPDRSLFGEVEAEPFDSTHSLFNEAGEAYESSLEEARAVLMRAVRTEAPVAGSLTLIRLKRARTAAELAEMLDEVEARITRPSRSLHAQQTMRRARQLLLLAGHQAASSN